MTQQLQSRWVGACRGYLKPAAASYECAVVGEGRGDGVGYKGMAADVSHRLYERVVVMADQSLDHLLAVCTEMLQQNPTGGAGQGARCGGLWRQGFGCSGLWRRRR